MASDDFTNSNGTALETHDSNWAETSSSSGDGGEIQDNHYRDSNDWNHVRYYYTGGDPDLSQIVVAASIAPSYIGPACRVPTTNDGYSSEFEQSGGNWTNVTLNKNGSWLAGASISYSTSSTRTFKTTTSGTTTVTFKAFVDGTEEATVDDSSSPLSGGAPGFGTGPEGDATDCDFDDWTDGAAAGVTGKSHPLMGLLGGPLSGPIG